MATFAGVNVFKSLDLDESEEQIKATAGKVYGWMVHNTNAALRYLKFYDGTAATVIVGTTVPVLTIPLLATNHQSFSIPAGIKFSTAITVAATTGLADNDTGAPGANEVIVNVFYE